MKRRRTLYSRPDAHTRRAKQAGYAARSVYKLEEIDRKWRLLRPGQCVVDLGASPGSWSQYAAKRVGPQGKVFALDLKGPAMPLAGNIAWVEGDAFALDPSTMPRCDVLLSDMAPATTGHASVDHARSLELFLHAVQLASMQLLPGGHFVGKLFAGSDFAEARQALEQCMREVRLLRPEATRKQSREIFLVGCGRVEE